MIPVLITACSTNKAKFVLPRLQAITIHGETVPQYAFKYDQAGRMTELVRYNFSNDTNTTRFSYDQQHRLQGMECYHHDNNGDQLLQRATVKKWDRRGNILSIDYFDATDTLQQSATIQWQQDLPLSLKYAGNRHATSWSYKNGNPDWKNIAADSIKGKEQDTTVFFTKANYEWDDSINPLKPLINQLLLASELSPSQPMMPLPSICQLLLHVSTNNPALIKIEEKQKTTLEHVVTQCKRSTTIQYFYAYNSNGYPKSARVHLHSQGFTGQGTDAQANIDYTYE